MKIRIKLPALHAGQQSIKNNAARFNAINCGRRYGKTILGEDLFIAPAINGYPTAWFAPNYKYLIDAWADVSIYLSDIIENKNKQDYRMTLITGGILDFWTLDNPEAGRGRKYKRTIIDEAAIAPNLKVAWEQSIRQTLVDYRGDAFFFSTPKGRNYFWHICNQAKSGDPEWKYFHALTSENPFISLEEIEAARQSLPADIFRQEYEAEFLEGEGTVFRNIDACMHAPETTPEQHKGHNIVAGVDWGKQNDFTTISIGCIDCHVEIARDRFNKIDYHFQRDRLKALCDKWNVNQILVELNSIGEPNFEELQRDGLPVIGFKTTASSKSPLIENLALALEKEEWQFQDDIIWTSELEAYERKVSQATGRSSYSAPDGMHDDTVIARALMLRVKPVQEVTQHRW